LLSFDLLLSIGAFNAYVVRCIVDQRSNFVRSDLLYSTPLRFTLLLGKLLTGSWDQFLKDI